MYSANVLTAGPMTCSPGFQPLTPSPSALISPANSVPARAGLAGALAGRSAAPRISSPRFVPAARTATTTWPGPAVGAGASRSSNTAPSAPGTANHAFIVWLMTSPSLQLQVLVRRDVGMSRDRRQLGQPWPDAGQERRLHDRREHRLLVHQLLDLVQHALAPPPVHLGRLVAEERVDIRIAAVGGGDRESDHQERATKFHRVLRSGASVSARAYTGL